MFDLTWTGIVFQGVGFHPHGQSQTEFLEENRDAYRLKGPYRYKKELEKDFGMATRRPKATCLLVNEKVYF